MLKANNIVKKTLYKEWATAPYYREGRKLHRRAILENVLGLVDCALAGSAVGLLVGLQLPHLRVKEP